MPILTPNYRPAPDRAFAVRRLGGCASQFTEVYRYLLCFQ